MDSKIYISIVIVLILTMPLSVTLCIIEWIKGRKNQKSMIGKKFSLMD